VELRRPWGSGIEQGLGAMDGKLHIHPKEATFFKIILM